jgi:RnfABCDGE-type electron transport complex B subunit
MTAVTSVIMMVGLTTVLATLLVLTDRWTEVRVDPRIGAVEALLPHTNCGACGYPGCHAFALALVSGETTPVKCTVSNAAQHARLASFLGIDVGLDEKRVARLACAGGSNVARNRAHYEGPSTCAAAALVAGGGKACFWGCLGLADCAIACDFDAITLDAHRIPVVDEDRCTACGDCVTACPKDLFSLHPANDRLWVACASLAEGEQILLDCQVACTGCGRCAMDAPDQITMRNSLPVIDYHCGPLTAAPTQRCPTGAIVWLDKQAGPIKGRAATKVVRNSELREGIS